MIEKIKGLEEYLIINNMNATAQILRQQIFTKLSPEPTKQLIDILEKVTPTNIFTNSLGKNKSTHTSVTNHTDQSKLKRKETNQHQLQVQGLLGKIAYSPNLLEDYKLNSKVYELMQMPFFEKAHHKLFPETLDKKIQPLAKNSTKKLEISQKDGEIKQNNKPLFFSADSENLKLSEKSQPCFENLSIQQNYYFDCDINPFLNLRSEHIKGQSFESQKESSGLISQPSIVDTLMNSSNPVDQYLDDNDIGYIEYIFGEVNVLEECSKLTRKYGYPQKAIKMSTVSLGVKKQLEQRALPQNVTFPETHSEFYPVEYNGVIFDTFSIPVIFNREKTGLEDKRNLKLYQNCIVAGRYRIISKLGNGVFAKAFKSIDILTGKEICLKMIINNKDYFDQAIDQVKILRYVNANYNPDQCHLLKFNKAFYTQQHLFFETELLQDNLYNAYRKNPSFFSIPIIKQIGKQILIALNCLETLHVIHADLKPQNILIKDYDPISVKLVDFGNSFFSHNRFTDYIQSRSYRAPEVVLGIKFDEKIDIWSLGCVLAQLWTKNLLFANLHSAGLLAKIQGIVGPWPEWMIEQGKYSQEYFSRENLIFVQEGNRFHIMIPKITNLRSRIRTDDEQFLDILQKMLEIDPHLRISAEGALQHPFFK